MPERNTNEKKSKRRAFIYVTSLIFLWLISWFILYQTIYLGKQSNELNSQAMLGSGTSAVFLFITFIGSIFLVAIVAIIVSIVMMFYNSHSNKSKTD